MCWPGTIGFPNFKTISIFKLVFWRAVLSGVDSKKRGESMKHFFKQTPQKGDKYYPETVYRPT